MAGARITSLFVVAALLAGACDQPPEDSEEPDEGPQVVAAFYPLAWVAREVGGGDASVSDLTPSGADAHDLELTSSQVLEIARADLVLYVGGGFQPAVEEAVEDFSGDAVDVVAELGVEVEEGEETDPHLWLDPVRMREVAALVGGHLAAVHPERAEDYTDRARTIGGLLEDLHDEFRSDLAECERRELVVSHEAFGHLAERYELTQVGISGPDPEAEPSPQRVAEVVRFIERNDVTTVFFERQVSPRIAEVIAEQTGAATDALDPLESPPPTGDYLDAMLANLDALALALGCR